MRRLLPAENFAEMKEAVIALTKNIRLCEWIITASGMTGKKSSNFA